MKKSKKISVLISLVLILILALSAVSAADDVATEDVELASVDEVQVVDDAPINYETYTESNDVVQTDTGDSGDSDVTSEEEVISDSTGLQDESDDGYEEAIVSNDVNPKNGLKAESQPDEPLRAPDGNFSALYALINNAAAGSTITLDRNYVYDPNTDYDTLEYYDWGWTINGIRINKGITIEGNGFTINGNNQMRAFYISGGYTITLNNINFINCNAGNCDNTDGGAINQYDNRNALLTINNCNFTNNRANYGGAINVRRGTVNIISSSLIGNVASYGGAIYTNGGNTILQDSAILNNIGTGSNIYINNGNYNFEENWWGTNNGPENTVRQGNNYLKDFDYFIMTETLTSPSTVEVNLVLKSGNTPSAPLVQRPVTVSSAVAQLNPTEGYCPDAFTTRFTTTEEATITATVDNQVLTLKVFPPAKENIKELNVTIANVTLPNKAQIVVDSDVNGTFNVTIGSTTKEITLTNGHGTLTWDSLPEGQYFAIVSRTNDPIYNDKFAYTSFKVEKADVSLTIEADRTAIEYGESVTITPTINPDALADQIKYYVDGNEVSSATLTNLPVGTHTVVAKYAGDDNYNAAESNAVTVTVSKATPIITVVASHNAYPVDGMIVVVVQNQALVPLNGVNLRVTVNGVTYALETENEGATLRLSGLNAGEYPITVVSIADENFNSATNDTEKLIVEKNNLTIVAGTNASSVPYGSSIGFTNTINAPAGAVTSGRVTYIIDGQVEIDVDSISGLDIGPHTVVAVYSNDPNFNVAESDPVTFTVTKADPTLTISANATEINYPDSIKLSYSITPNDATGSVVYYLGETAIDGDTLTRLDPGTYTVTARYEGNDYYNAVDSSNSLSITVGKGDVSIEVTTETYTIEYGDDLFISRALTPSTATGVVTFIVDGVETDQQLISGLTVGIHTIAAKFRENVYWNGAISETKIVTVTKATPIVYVAPNNVSYPNDANVVIMVYDKNHNGLDGITVKVTVNGVTYAIETINGGNNLMIEGLDVGKYPITAVTVANENYASATNDTQKLEIYKANLTITAVPSATSVVMGDEISFTNTITAPEGAVTSGTVTYYVDGEAISGDSISDLSVGTHSVVAKYTGDPNFNDAQSTAVPFTVTEAAIVVTGQSTSVIYPNKGNIVITTNVAGTYTIKVGEDYSKDVELEAGENTVAIDSILDAGTYDVSVSATIDNYKPVEDKVVATYTVNKAQSTIDVTYEDGEFTITLDGVEGEKLSETVKVAIDGTAIDSIETDDGVYTFTYAGLAPGRHSILVTFEGNTNYLGDSKNYGFDVDKHTPTLEVFIGNLVYGQDAYIIAELKEGDTGLTGVVEVTIRGYEDPFIVAVAEGTGILPIAGLNAGTYTYTAKSVADSTYDSVGPTEEQTFTVNPKALFIDIQDLSIDYGEEGGIRLILEDPETGERIVETVELIFTNEDEEELARIEATSTTQHFGGTELPFTSTWAIGNYFITASNPNYVFITRDESHYEFTSYGDEEGTIVYSTGTVEVVDVEDEDYYWIKVRVLTNDADESFVGNEYYLDPDMEYDLEGTWQLYVFDEDEEDFIGTGIWVQVSEIIVPFEPATFGYEVRKAGLEVEVVEGEGRYLYRDEHVIVLNLLKDGELFEINCPATIEVVVANWDDLEVVRHFDTNFINGAVTIDVSDVEPGSYMLKVSIDDEHYAVRMDRDEEDGDYCIIDSHDHERPLFDVMEDHLTLEEVTGVDNGRFRDERIFYFELWHHHWDEDIDDDVWGLFEYSTTTNVTVYSIVYDEELDEEVFNVVYNNENVAITNGRIGESIDFTYLPAGDYKITVSLIDPYYQLEGWDDNFGRDVDYSAFCFHIENDNLYANVDGTYWTEYGQDRIFKFDLMHWDEEAKEDVLFEYDTKATVKVYKLTWDDDGVEHAELIETYENVAINGGQSAEIDLSDMNAGSYRVTIQLDDENGYEIDRWFNDQYGIQEERFDVGRANVDITVEFDKDGYIYGDDVIVTVTITPQTTDEKLTEEIELNIMGKKSIKKHLVEGVATFTLEDYEAALYTIWVNFKGTDNYNDIYNYIDSFIIDKASPVINVNPREEEYTYGGDVIIDVTLYDGETGLTATAIVNVDGTDYVVNIENGEGTLTISGLAANENGYGIAASVAATDNYNGAGYDGDAKVVVNKVQPTLDVAAIEMTYGESDELIITLDGVNGEKLSGVITVTVNEEDHDVTITDGVGTLPITGLNAGRYDVTASFTGNDNYKSDEITKSIAIIVKKADPTITVDANATAIKYGESIKLTSEVTPTSGGAVIYYLGETALDSDVLSDLTPGTYTVVAKVAETDNYNEASSEALTITVAKADASIEVKIADDELTFGESTTLSNVITPEGLTGEVTYYVDGEVITGTTVSGLSVGTHTVVAKLAETDNYNAAESAAKTITVSKATPAIEITSDPVSYPNDAVVNIVLTGANNVALPGATIRVTVGGTTYAVTTDEEGKASLTVKGLGADIYDITAVSVADDNYESVTYTGDTKVVVNKATDAKLDVELVGDEIVVTLTGGDDTPLDGTVNLVIDDGTAVPVTITNGQGSYDASSLTAGTHTVEATSVADDNYESVSVTKDITKGSAPNEAIITVSVASIIYGQDAEITVTLTDSEGNPVEGTLDVTVGETTKQVIIGTDGIGYVAFSDLTVGHYTATVSFAGDETYKPTSKEATFDVSKVGTAIYSEDIVVTANVAGTMEFTLKDLNGNILAGRTVTLTFNGQTFNKTSDEDGKFTVDINMANQGTYTISASYAGEADYEASTASYDVVVKPIATKLTVSDVTYGLSETKYLTATLTAGDEPLANKIVTFSLNGKTYTGRTNATGVVRIAVSLTAKKTYSVVASYGGDTTYGSAMAIYKLKVVKS